MKCTKRWAAILLSAVLLLGLLPATVLAEEEAPPHWAQSAVDALNGIYGVGVFSTDDDPMTIADAQEIFDAAGYGDADGSEPLARAKAAEILAEVYDLAVPEETSAIFYLYEQNIVNGRGPDNLAENEPVTKAEFAVLTYRVLNFVGGGMGSSVEGLTPGSVEYFSWMYLAARRCVPFTSDAAKAPFSEETWSGEDGWKVNLKAANVSDEKLAAAENVVIGTTFDNNLDAAAAVVTALEAETIFADVAPGDYYYDGVMYLFDHGIISGYGDGRFGPHSQITRAEFAVILCRAGGLTLENNPDWAEAAMKAANEAGYIDWDIDTAGQTLTRSDAVTALLKASEINLSENENTAILERFDENIPSDDAPYIAYAVSHGLLRGTAAGTLDLAVNATRAQVGVLLYRALIGVDQTKMKDYADSVDYAKGGKDAVAPQTLSLIAPLAETEDTDAPTTPAPTLTLREDWRLTSDLDLNVDEGESLIVDGTGFYIYEMGGKLINSGTGSVRFKEGTVVYPQSESDTTVSLDAFHLQANVTGSTVTFNTEYPVMIKSSGHENVIDLEGKITKPSGTVSVTLELELYDEDNNFYADSTIVVKVSGTGGGSSGNGSSGGASSTPGASVSTPETNGGTTTVDVNTNAATSGTTANATVNSANMDQAVASAVTEASKQGTAPVVTVAVKTSANADSLNVTLPAASLKKLTEANGASLLISSDVAEVALDSTALGALVDQAAGSTVTLAVAPVSDAALSAAQKEAVGDAPVVDLALVSNGAAIHDYKSGTITVSLPYTLTDGQNANHIVVYYLDDDGSMTPCSTHYANGKVTFTTTHLSKYVIGTGNPTSEQPSEARTFTDVAANAWYRDSVYYVVEKGLMKGTGTNIFEPDAGTTRAMLVTILYRMEGAPAVGKSTFADVPAGQWYTESIAWAAANNIVNGYGADRFGTDDPITREQIAAILYRYATFKGHNVTGQADMSVYTDFGAVNDWASAAMRWAVSEKLIEGTTGTTLNPDGYASRAQAATILMRFCEEVVK